MVRDEIERYIKQYGTHFLSFSVNQENIKYFLLKGVGFIAFKEVKSGLLGRITNVVSDNPITTSEFYEDIITEFIKKHPNSAFFMCDSRVADILSKFNYYINEWGEEHYYGLEEFNLNRRKRKLLRRWKSKFEKREIIVEEFNFNKSNRVEYLNISREWLAEKGGTENNFVNRPLHYKNLQDTRQFHLRDKESILGFIIFDPIYSEGRVIGYYQNIVRYLDCTHSGLVTFALIKAIEKFKSENLEVISLGVAPGVNINTNNYLQNRSLNKTIRFLVKYCNFIYPAKGIHFNKRIFNFNTRKTYYASKRSSIAEFGVIYNSCKK